MPPVLSEETAVGTVCGAAEAPGVPVAPPLAAVGEPPLAALVALAAPALVADWLVIRFAKDETWQLPVELMWLMVVIWVIAANSHVVKAAFEWSSFASVALVILQMYAGALVVMVLFAPTVSGTTG